MASEAVTRNDLTAILNEVLPSVKKFGERQAITLPYTAPSDGIVQVYATAKQISGAYSALYIQCATKNNYGYCISNMPALGGAVTGSFLAKKGEQITQSYASNITSTAFYFIPFD